MVRSSFSILFFIRESKARKSGKAPIELMITVNGERCPLSTGKQVPIDKWDKTKQQVKGKDEKAQSLNNYLKAIKARLYQKEAELLDRGFIITAELLRDAYFDKVESLKEKSLFEVFEEHNNEQEKLVGNGISKATYWISVYTVRLLKEFVQQKYKREDLYLREMRQPRMHSDAQFAGSSSVPAHVEMMGFLGIGNNPMVGCTVACAVDVATALNK